MPSTSGTIYAIGVGDGAPVKIGKTSGVVAKRLAALQIAHPLPLKVLASVPVARDLSRIEKAIHRFLETERQQGEWFAVTIDQAQLEALIVRALQWLEEHAAPAVVQPITTTLGARVAFRRKALGLTQQDLGSKAGCPYQVISRLESGKQSVFAERLAAIAEALLISTDYLLGREPITRELLSCTPGAPGHE